MPDFLIKLIGLLLILSTVGVVSCQALAAPADGVSPSVAALSAPRA
ncbi:MAG: hypothetical protein JNK31_08050 [Candidatus Competibacter sp.]|nr:hypothetical protein [Candidatus Competibacter sp.]